MHPSETHRKQERGNEGCGEWKSRFVSNGLSGGRYICGIQGRGVWGKFGTFGTHHVLVGLFVRFSWCGFLGGASACVCGHGRGSSRGKCFGVGEVLFNLLT